ncbi:MULTISPECIES: IS30 family transposase [Streptomyces]|uniref:IS30 family transposase n=1 Tax=Streptomyces TaxID=1883 RepID=UPI00331F7176
MRSPATAAETATADAAAYGPGRRPKQAKLAQRLTLRALVEAKLALCWSPEQIAGWLRRQFPDDASMQISHEAIYLSLYDGRRRQATDRSLTQRLRSGRPMRRPKLARRPTGRGIIRSMVPITDRPAQIEDRKVPGHWEGDLVMGTRPSAVATLAERTSRYTTIVALPDGIKAEQVTPHLTTSLLNIPPQLRRTLTWGRAREIAEHQAISAVIRMPIYLCKPRSPWQRGTKAYASRRDRAYLRRHGIRCAFPDKADQAPNHRKHGSRGGRPPYFDSGPRAPAADPPACRSRPRRTPRPAKSSGTVTTASIRSPQNPRATSPGISNSSYAPCGPFSGTRADDHSFGCGSGEAQILLRPRGQDDSASSWAEPRGMDGVSHWRRGGVP